MRITQRRIIPDSVTGYELNPARGWIEVVLADGTRNLAKNPSFERNANGTVIKGAGTTITVTDAYQKRGARCLKVIPDTGVNDGFHYNNFDALGAGLQYWASFDFRGTAGLKYKTYFATSGAVLLGAPVKFTATGRWQRIYLPWREIANASRRLYIVKDGSANVQPFYVDGIQIEQKDRWTTYADGDMAGLIPNFDDFYWLGEPHNSHSVRVDNSAAGGRMYNLKQFGFRLMSIVGLGLSAGGAVFSPIATGGAIYQGSTVADRPFTLVGDMSGMEWQELGMRRQALTDLFKPSRVSPEQPVLIRYTPCDDAGNITGDTIEIPCVLDEDPDGEWASLNSQRIGLTFRLYLPFVGRVEGDAGTELSYQVSVPDANYIVYQDTGGAWHAIATGATGGNVYALTVGLDGKIYIGGAFTDFDGLADTAGIVVYDPTTGIASALGTGLHGGTSCLSLDTDAIGNIWCTGLFTDAGGVSDTQNIAYWDITLQVWVSVGASGASTTGQCVYAAPDGSIYATFVGNPTTVDGVSVQGVGKYTAGTWTDFGDASFLSPRSLIFANGYFYTGDYDTSPASAKIWRRTASGAWSQIAESINGFNTTFDISVGLNGKLYFTSDGDLGADLIHGIAEYDGVGLSQLNGGTTGLIYEALPLSNGDLLVHGYGNTFGNVDFPDSIAIWNQSSWASVGIDLPNLSTVFKALEVKGFGKVIGYDQSGTAIAEAVQTVNNAGSDNAYPRFTFNGPGPLYFVKNYTTQRAVYFNLTLLDGEQAVLDFTDPLDVTFTSNFRGNILNTIAPGSSFDFFLKPGDNAISVFLNWDGIAIDHNDSYNSISSIELTGVTLDNSDYGKIYVAIDMPPGGPYSITFYSDEAQSNAVAELSATYMTTGTKTVVPLNGSGISGTLYVDSVDEHTNHTIYFRVPIVTMTWRNTHASTDGAFPGRLVR